MITSETSKVDILNLQNKQPEKKIIENKKDSKEFKDIISKEIDIKSNENLGVTNNTEENDSKEINDLQLENNNEDMDKTEVLLSSIVEKLQGIIDNKTSDDSYNEYSKDIQLVNGLLLHNSELKSTSTEKLPLDLASSKETELRSLGDILINLITELNSKNLQGSLKESSQLFTQFSNITKELEKLSPTQLKQVSLKDLHSLKEMVKSALEKVEAEPNSALEALSSMAEDIQNIVINKAANEPLDLNLISNNKKKELKELAEVLTKLGEQLKGKKLQEGLKESSQLVTKISNTVKELEKLIDTQLEPISLEDLSSLKKTVEGALEKNDTESNNILAVLPTIMEKFQSSIDNITRNESYNGDSKDTELLNRLLVNENQLNFANKLGLKFTSDKNQEVKEIDSALTQLVTDIKDENLQESLKENPKVFREMFNIVKEISKLQPKQLEQISLDDLNALKEIAKSALNEVKAIKERQPKKLLKENLISINNSLDLERNNFRGSKSNLKEDLPVDKITKNHSASKLNLVEDENTANNNKEDSVLKKIIDGSEKKNENILMFTQRFNELKKADQVKSDLVINKNTVVNDVVKTVKYMTENNERTLTVKMNPKDLGEITIKLVAQGESMKATITTASKDTLSLLSAKEMDMKKMLDAQGIKISEVNISLYNDDTTFFREEAGFGRQNGNQRHNENQNRTVTNIELEDEKVNEVLDNTNINMFA